MDIQTRERVAIVGASVLGASVVLGGAFWLLESASRRDALKINVVTALEPADRDLLRKIVGEVHVATSELSSSLDRISEHGIPVILRPFGARLTS